MKKTIGGDRLGAGKKMKVDLHNYGRSTHNLARAWRSSMAPGTLVPFLVEPSLNGDTFDIDINTLVRTLPTNGPLFGSFKLQIDIFEAPIRLYQAMLHNNASKIGMDMSKVRMPVIEVTGRNLTDGLTEDVNQKQISQSSLLAYLGMRGLGRDPNAENMTIQRRFNAVPYFMYWDIYKNYYANKQEEIGMVMSPKYSVTQNRILATGFWEDNVFKGWKPTAGPVWDALISVPPGGSIQFAVAGNGLKNINSILICKDGEYEPAGQIEWEATRSREFRVLTGNHPQSAYWINTPNIPLTATWEWQLVYRNNTEGTIEFGHDGGQPNVKINPAVPYSATGEHAIEPFRLANIDDLREDILAKRRDQFVMQYHTELDEPFASSIGVVGGGSAYETSISEFTMAGLGLKTYQSDIFNNWLSTEWIDGAQGIAMRSAVQVIDGQFTIDSLNLANKVYNMLNRIAISGGSYMDWQEAVYGEDALRMAEIPIYMGGASAEIVFNEVVSTAEATADTGEPQPLGSLGGRGSNTDQKGGTIRIKTREPSFIMGIVSITPRIDYSQGNKWWTRLQHMDEWHKPALDGIGFQDLLTEQIAAWDTEVQTGTYIPKYKAAGKLPAWMDYMTSYNETYGEFADENKTMFMTLNRRYERGADGRLLDLTTYIDPMKFNYAFAQASRDAQNFWVQMGIDVTARRKMSAKIIPNL